MAVVVRIGNCPEAVIEPGRTGNDWSRTGFIWLIRSPGNGIDVHSVRDISDGVAVADDVVGVGAVVSDAGREDFS